MKKNRNCLFIWVAGILFMLVSCEKDPKPGNYWIDPESGAWLLDGNLIPSAVRDVDGNIYDAIRIGPQIWMQQNLRTTHYPDSTPIERLLLPGENELSVEYGYLYDWNTAVHGEDSSTVIQGICPDGWHLPNWEEWENLCSFLKSSSHCYYENNTESIAKLLASTSGWNFCNDNSLSPGQNQLQNNATGFSAFPAGYYKDNYSALGASACFWSSTSENPTKARTFSLESCWAQPNSSAVPRTNGCSVRCIKN